MAYGGWRSSINKRLSSAYLYNMARLPPQHIEKQPQRQHSYHREARGENDVEEWKAIVIRRRAKAVTNIGRMHA